MAAVRTRAALALAALVAGCGDGLVDEQYRGVPAYTIQGDVDSGDSSGQAPAGLQVALFFSPKGLNGVDPTQWVEDLASTTPVTGLPSAFVMNVFARPGADLLVHSPQGGALGYGLARILAYEDQDRDGRHGPGEPFVGMEKPMAYLYLPAALPAGQTPTGGALPGGLLHVLLPQSCGYKPPAPTMPGSCGVPLGAPCNADADCQGGTCLNATSLPWSNGYCVVTEPPANGCRPGGAAFMGAPMQGAAHPGVMGYYLRPCVQDTDCSSPGRGPYLCDPGLRACTATVPVRTVPIDGSVQPLPFCAGN